MPKKFGMFQVQDEQIVAVYPQLVNYFDNRVRIKINGKQKTLISDYYVKDFILKGEITMLMMYESCGKLYPVRANPLFDMPIETPDHPSIPVHTAKDSRVEDAEYLRLMDERKNLISDILNEIAKRDAQKGLDELLQISNFQQKQEKFDDLLPTKNETISKQGGTILRL